MKNSITGMQLSSILKLELKAIGLDKYVRLRRVGVGHEDAVDVITCVQYIRVRDYTEAIDLRISHRQIIKLAEDGFDLRDINKLLLEGASFRSTKQACKVLIADDYVLLRRKMCTHKRIMEFAQLCRDHEWTKWKHFIKLVRQDLEIETAFKTADYFTY